MSNVAVNIANHLLRIRAVFFRPQEPFTWASGITSPVYCDNRLILTDPEARVAVESAIAEEVKKKEAFFLEKYPEESKNLGKSCLLE